MSDDTRGVPVPVERDHTIATRAAVLEKLFDRYERDFKEFKAETIATFKLGAQSMADIRGEVARMSDALSGKLSARHEAVNDDVGEVRAELRAEIQAVGAGLGVLAEQVAPRATTFRLIGWCALALTVVGGPVTSYFVFKASTPDRTEFRELERRVRDVEFNQRPGARGATP